MDAKDASLGFSKAAPAKRELGIVTTGLWGICPRSKQIAVIAFLLGAFLTTPVFAQISEPVSAQIPDPALSQIPKEDQQRENAQASASQPAPGNDSADPKAPAGPPAPADPPEVKPQLQGRQPKRILWVIPNYRAVSANTQLPPLAPKQKLWLATEDSFDYSSFALAAIVAGLSQATKGTPEFGHGGSAYGRYLWHTFTDEAVGNYFTEALLPIATHQDPRYYTLGPSGGGFLHRTGYSLTRLLITRTDSGRNTFNSSEVVGNLAAAAISDLYYPRPERTWGQTGQKWAVQLGIDAFFDMAKEFWPDIDQHIFHGKYGSGR
jgi:hypothetical protein